MIRHFRKLCNKIILLAFFYMVNVIIIKQNILYINIIILKIPYTKFIIFNLVYNLLYIYIIESYNKQL